MRLKFGRYVLYFGKDRRPEPIYNPKLMEKLKDNSVEVSEPKLTREEKIRKWQREHKDQINENRRKLYNGRKEKGVCVKCGKTFRGKRPVHTDGSLYLICVHCREEGNKSKEPRGRGRPKGSKNKRKVGRPKSSKNKG